MDDFNRDICSGEESLNKTADKEKITGISSVNALMIIYYLIGADGRITEEESRKFDEIGPQFTDHFDDVKSGILHQYARKMDTLINISDLPDLLKECVDELLVQADQKDEQQILPKQLLWNLLVVAYSDNEYSEPEEQLIRHILRKLDVDKTVYLEMESSLKTMLEIDHEINWIKTVNRPYSEVRDLEEELTGRYQIVMESIKDLIAL